MDVNTRRLSGLKYKLVCCFKSTVDMIGGCIREFVYEIDGPAFPERELIRFGVDGTSRSESMTRKENNFG